MKNRPTDFDEDPTGPEYDRLADLARLTRPAAPPDLVDRVMRAVTVTNPKPAGFSLPDIFARLFGAGPLRIPGPLGAMALLGLAFLLAALVLRPAGPEMKGFDDPELVLHRFEFVAPGAEKVCLVGDFNAWELCRMPLVKDSETGAWSVEVPLPPGRHEYMFVVDDGAWVTDPAAPVQTDDGFGNRNAVVFL